MGQEVIGVGVGEDALEQRAGVLELFNLRIFLPQKMADLTVSLKILANWDPFLRVFLPQKWLILQLRIFLTKMGPLSLKH